MLVLMLMMFKMMIAHTVIQYVMVSFSFYTCTVLFDIVCQNAEFYNEEVIFRPDNDSDNDNDNDNDNDDGGDYDDDDGDGREVKQASLSGG